MVLVFELATLLLSFSLFIFALSWYIDVAMERGHW